MPTPFSLLAGEAELLQQIAAGNEQAYTRLYHVYTAHVKRYLATSTGLSGEDQDDLIQEVFLAVWEKRALLTHISSFKGYLFIIVRNKVINTYRHNSKRLQVFKHLSFSQPYQYDGLEEDLLYRFYVAKTAEAIRLLPERVRIVFEISSAHVITAAQIAVRLHISIHMVRKYIQRANSFIINYLRDKADWLITWIGPFLIFIF